jgi:deazaflavin-dependent oxidoreductase (nitroreductase family)
LSVIAEEAAMATVRQGPEVQAYEHEQWVDSLRVLVIALVIIVHTATGYVTDIAGWYYDDELTTSQLWTSVLGPPAGLGAFFALGPLFVLAGWFSTRSVARRGPAGFARSRLIRLGVPLVLFVLVVQPLTDYIGNRWDEPDRTLGSYLAETEVGAMWFIAALLCFSLVYALTEALHPAEPQHRPLRPALLVATPSGRRSVNRSVAVRPGGHGPVKPLLGLRRQPGRFALAVFRLPLALYHRGWGWLVGHAFLLLVHVGRRTGKRYETVAMILRYDRDTGEAVICSAWGQNADWVRNLRAGSALEVRLARESFVPEQRFLSDNEGVAVAVEFRRRHPWRLRLLSRVLGWGNLASTAAVRDFVRTRPFVSLRPRVSSPH